MHIEYLLSEQHNSTPLKFNKTSNYTAGNVRVEAYLPGTSAVCAIFLLQMHYKKMFDLENEGQGHGVQHSQW